MFTARKKVLIALAVIGLVAPIALSTPAQAETFVFSSAPLTNLDPAGATINGGFTKFPTKAGLYIQQCIAPVGAARPATCDDVNQLWVTATGEQGSISSTGPIAMKVSSSIKSASKASFNSEPFISFKFSSFCIKRSNLPDSNAV